MLQHSSVFHGTSCVPTCPRPDSNRRRPPPEGGALSSELRGRMSPPRDDARKTSSGSESCTSALQYSPSLRDGGFSVRPMVFNARSTRTLLITRPTTSYRISLPISRSYANCGRAPVGIGPTVRSNHEAGGAYQASCCTVRYASQRSIPSQSMRPLTAQLTTRISSGGKPSSCRRPTKPSRWSPSHR